MTNIINNSINEIEKNVILAAYYTAKAEESISMIHQSVNSRLKDEECFRWRIAKNKAELYEAKTYLSTTPAEKIKNEKLIEINKLINQINDENNEILKYDIKTSDLSVDSIDDVMVEYSKLSPNIKTIMEDKYNKSLSQYKLDNSKVKTLEN